MSVQNTDYYYLFQSEKHLTRGDLVSGISVANDISIGKNILLQKMHE